MLLLQQLQRREFGKWFIPLVELSGVTSLASLSPFANSSSNAMLENSVDLLQIIAATNFIGTNHVLQPNVTTKLLTATHVWPPPTSTISSLLTAPTNVATFPQSVTPVQTNLPTAVSFPINSSTQFRIKHVTTSLYLATTYTSTDSIRLDSSSRNFVYSDLSQITLMDEGRTDLAITLSGNVFDMEAQRDGGAQQFEFDNGRIKNTATGLYFGIQNNVIVPVSDSSQAGIFTCEY